jgi:hypothetical protein
MPRTAAEELQLEHYLDALSKKPGALAGSMTLEQCRAQGRWPESFDHFSAKLEQRHRKQEGTRAMVKVLLLGRDHGFERLRAVVEQALDMGVSDVAAIRYLLEIDGLEKRALAEALDVGWLKQYERPQPTLQEYDSLLAVTLTEVIQ